MVVDTVRDDLGVRIGGEFVTCCAQLFAQLFVILDDAVVHDRQTIARDVWMGIALGRHAVSGPTGMRDTKFAVGGRGVDGVLQHLHFTDGANTLEVAGAVEHRDAGGVVATIFEPTQTLHEHRDDVTVCDGTDDSTHDFLSAPPGVRAYGLLMAASSHPGSIVWPWRRLVYPGVRCASPSIPHRWSRPRRP